MPASQSPFSRSTATTASGLNSVRPCGLRGDVAISPGRVGRPHRRGRFIEGRVGSLGRVLDEDLELGDGQPRRVDEREHPRPDAGARQLGGDHRTPGVADDGEVRPIEAGRANEARDVVRGLGESVSPAPGLGPAVAGHVDRDHVPARRGRGPARRATRCPRSRSRHEAAGAADPRSHPTNASPSGCRRPPPSRDSHPKVNTSAVGHRSGQVGRRRRELHGSRLANDAATRATISAAGRSGRGGIDGQPVRRPAE